MNLNFKLKPVMCSKHRRIIYRSRISSSHINGVVVERKLLDRFFPERFVSTAAEVFSYLEAAADLMPLCCKVPEDELACIFDEASVNGCRPHFWMNHSWR